MPSQSKSETPTQDSTALLRSVYIQPDIRRGRITVHLEVASPCSIELSIPELKIRVEASPGKNSVSMDGFVAWTPGTPHLYSLACAVRGEDDRIETCSVSFGMREFTVKENRFFFNSRPLYIKGYECTDLCASAQGNAEGLATCLGSLKEAGFNLLRVGACDVTQAFLEIADELGFLVECEIRKKTELDCIRAYRNHASVVFWNLLRVDDPDIASLREVDPGRLYFYSDRESGEARCARPYRDDFQRIEVITIGHRIPASRRSQMYCEHMGDGSVLSYISDFTIGGLEIDPDEKAVLDADLIARELSKIIPGVGALGKRTHAMGLLNLRSLVDSVRTNGNIAGYCVRGEIGSSDRVAARIDALAHLKSSHASARPLITIAQNNLVPRQETPVKVHFLNEEKLEGRADLSLQVVGPTNQVLWKKKREVRLPKSGKLLWEGAIAASGSTGKHRFIVRITQNMQRLCEASVEFFVYPPVESWEGTINLIDPDKRWDTVCSKFVSSLEFKSRLHIIPPIANSIRAYPDNELAQVLGRVNEGAVALFFQPPEDWNDFASFIDPELEATPMVANTVNPSQVHYAKSHPVFDSLPSRGIMGATYGEIVPQVTFLESSEEDICGCYRGSSFGKEISWGSHILVKKYGSGRIVFISLAILEELGQNPVADHLFVNLLKHFVRRSVPSQEGSFAVHQRSVEWIRQQRQNFTQNWAVVGMFPWSPNDTKAPVYPPENSVDLETTYPGWYRALSWKHWFPVAADGYTVNLDKALGPEFVCGATSDYGIAYAYAEVIGETRGEMRLVVDRDVRMEVWVNGALVYSSLESGEDEPSMYMKLGKNIVLVKLYKVPGPFSFKLTFEVKKEPVQFRWWK